MKIQETALFFSSFVYYVVQSVLQLAESMLISENVPNSKQTLTKHMLVILSLFFIHMKIGNKFPSIKLMNN